MQFAGCTNRYMASNKHLTNGYPSFLLHLLNIGFVQSHADNSLFIRTNGGVFIALLIYVDDIVIATNNKEEAAALKVFLDSKFRLKDLGELKYFLGIEVARSQCGISRCQRHYETQPDQKPLLMLIMQSL